MLGDVELVLAGEMLLLKVYQVVISHRVVVVLGFIPRLR
jgi:hypothetical protein